MTYISAFYAASPYVYCLASYGFSSDFIALNAADRVDVQPFRFAINPSLASAASYFSLLRQRNLTKRKATRLSGPLRGALRCSTQAGSRANSPLAQTSTYPFPLGFPLISPATRDFRERRNSDFESLAPKNPSGSAEQRSKTGNQKRACLSAARLHASPVLRAAQGARSEAKGRGQQGRLFFGDFLLAKQQKVTRQPGRLPAWQLPLTAKQHRANQTPAKRET